MVKRLVCPGGSLRWMPKLPRDLFGAKLRKALLKAGLVEKEVERTCPWKSGVAAGSSLSSGSQ